MSLIRPSASLQICQNSSSSRRFSILSRSVLTRSSRASNADRTSSAICLGCSASTMSSISSWGNSRSPDSSVASATTSSTSASMPAFVPSSSISSASAISSVSAPSSLLSAVSTGGTSSASVSSSASFTVSTDWTSSVPSSAISTGRTSNALNHPYAPSSSLPCSRFRATLNPCFSVNALKFSTSLSIQSFVNSNSPYRFVGNFPSRRS